MKILNLANPSASDITFEVSRYPDGQQNITIDCKQNVSINNWWSWIESVRKRPWQIKSRFNNFKDLELIICATKALRNLGVKEIHLYVPYLLGSRSDRSFEEGSTSYLVQIVAPILNSLNFESVIVLDVHSDVAAACINNLKVISNTELVRFAIRDIYRPLTENSTRDSEEYLWISPDAGAAKKIYKLAENINFRGDIITCSKSRDKDGKLTNTNVPLVSSHENYLKDKIIIDDICDGGATFINIAKKIKEQHNYISKNCNVKPGKIYLIVTHGIFSKGFSELSEYFDGVYCTNSYITTYYSTDRNDFKFEQLNIF